ncbi:MAG: hypothetical protein U1C33_07280, partial [Candidatus Cloacimonadaceae bacterium]|nr:hypothetical protein [Candidatus Cloacimonadaceae bacterium]
SGSPFSVAGDINIPIGDELSIENDVEVIFLDDYTFTVDGTLTADGISFATLDEGEGDRQQPAWRGLVFSSTAQASSLSNSVIKNASNPLVIHSNSVQVSGLTISKPDSLNFTDETAISIVDVSTSITNLNIENYAKGISIENSSGNRIVTTPTLTNIRIKNSSQQSLPETTGIEINGFVEAGMFNVELEDYQTGIKYVSDGSYQGTQTPTLTNIRIKNSSQQSREGSIGIYLKDLRIVNVINQPAFNDSIIGYDKGIVIETELANTSTPTLTNIRIKNSSQQSRTEQTGIEIDGKVSASINNVTLEDYYSGIKYSTTGTLATTPTLTNIRIKNSSQQSRITGSALDVKDVLQIGINDLEIEGYDTGIKLDNEQPVYATPTLTNIRIKNSSQQSRTDTRGIKTSGKTAPSITGIDLENCTIGISLIGDGSISTTTPTLTNIRIKKSSQQSRTDTKGLYIKDMGNIIVNGDSIVGYVSGIEIENELLNSSTPTLTNIRIKNSS